jgi:ADP-heptose:LPS heptosyltransferase
VVRSILVVKLRAIGDTVLSLPSIHALRRAFPAARLACVVSKPSLQILSADPAVDEVLGYDKRELARLAGHLKLFEDLQERRFDLCVCLHASFRSALLGWMSGAPWRSVRNHSGPDWFSNLRSSEPKRAKSILEREFDGLRVLGIGGVPEMPKMSLSKEAMKHAVSFWKKARLSGRKVVALVPGAGKPEKQWQLENFLTLSAGLKKKGFTPLWISAPGESLSLPSKEVPASFASLQDLGAVLGKAGWVIGNDSGPRHIAAACGARTFTLFGPEGLEEWHPYRRSDGHAALKAVSGKIEDLRTEEVMKQSLAWLKP